jgi:hypothetical protein
VRPWPGPGGWSWRRVTGSAGGRWCASCPAGGGGPGASVTAARPGRCVLTTWWPGCRRRAGAGTGSWWRRPCGPGMRGPGASGWPRESVAGLARGGVVVAGESYRAAVAPGLPGRGVVLAGLAARVRVPASQGGRAPALPQEARSAAVTPARVPGYCDPGRVLVAAGWPRPWLRGAVSVNGGTAHRRPAGGPRPGRVVLDASRPGTLSSRSTSLQCIGDFRGGAR